jgi:hypothetical protein
MNPHSILIWGDYLSGAKQFTNNTPDDLRVIITVRAGSNPGCVLNCIPFVLAGYETRTITYGNNVSSFLDGISACQMSNGQFTSTAIRATERGSDVDNLMNTNNHILFTIAYNSIVIVGTNS